jgi:branched-chain amino acid transport system permease protein
MDLSFIIGQFLSGLTMATLLFLVASGLTLIFGVGNVFNFAHGSFYMIGAYLAYQAVSIWHTNFWAATFVAAAGAGVLGMLAESMFLRRIYGRAEEGGFQILLTYSFILVIDDLVKLIWGTEYKSLLRPRGFSGSVEISGLTLPTYNLAIIGIGLIIVVLPG